MGDHGEDNHIDGHSSSDGNASGDNTGDEEQFDAMNEMVYDAIRSFFNVPNVNANMENETVSEGEIPNEEAQRFYDGLKPTHLWGSF